MNSNLNKLPDINGRYIVLDTETTGVDIVSDNLISISAVELINGRITGFHFNSYVRARNYKSNKEQIEVNANYFVEDYSIDVYDSERHTMMNFLRFVNDSIIFAHNAYFDFKFIEKELILWNLPVIPYDRYKCTISIAKNILTNKRNKSKYNLEDICSYFDFKFNKNDFHHGYFDAYMLARVVCKLFAIVETKKTKRNIFKCLLNNKLEKEEPSKNLNDISEIIGDLDNLNLTEHNETIYQIDEMIQAEPTSIPKDKIKSLMKTYIDTSISKKK